MYYFVKRQPRRGSFYAQLSKEEIVKGFSRGEIDGDWLVTANYFGESYNHLIRYPPTPANWITVNEFHDNTDDAVFETDFTPPKGAVRTDEGLLSFNGRIPRDLMWATWLVVTVVVFVSTLLVRVLGAALPSGTVADGVHAALVVPYAGVMVLCFWFSLAMNAKRWHDRNQSGWMVLINLIPIVGGLWSFIELGFGPGTKWANEYGSDDYVLQHRHRQS